jgi:hypothetical protein
MVSKISNLEILNVNPQGNAPPSMEYNSKILIEIANLIMLRYIYPLGSLLAQILDENIHIIT